MEIPLDFTTRWADLIYKSAINAILGGRHHIQRERAHTHEYASFEDLVSCIYFHKERERKMPRCQRLRQTVLSLRDA